MKGLQVRLCSPLTLFDEQNNDVQIVGPHLTDTNCSSPLQLDFLWPENRQTMCRLCFRVLFTAQIGLNLLIISFFSAPENRQLRIF